MNVNVFKFMEKYDSDDALRARVQEAVNNYPGSLDIRDALVEDVLLPIAAELGYVFTAEDLKHYETYHRAIRHKDVELTEEDLAQEDEDTFYWFEGFGWLNADLEYQGDL